MDAEGFLEFLKSQEELKVWADEYMILFTAAAFDLEIIWFTYGVQPELFHKTSDWNNTINIEGITLPNHNTIFLSHHDNEHFKYLRRLSEEEVDRAIQLNRDIRENYGHLLRPPHRQILSEFFPTTQASMRGF